MDNNGGCIGCKYYRVKKDMCAWSMKKDNGKEIQDCLLAGDCTQYEQRYLDYQKRADKILKEFEDLVRTCRSLGKGEYYKPTILKLRELYNEFASEEKKE